MRDIHCHILPGVDDGARDLTMSLAMLRAAWNAGVTSIVCTPHCRDPYFDYDRMRASFDLLQGHADGFPLTMGFEVAYPKLIELGIERWARRLSFEGSNEFLLELDPRCTERDFIDYERAIAHLQGMGLTVIIAHPERYRAIQQDTGIAVRLVEMGCLLQASSDFMAGGRFGREKKPVRRLIKQGLYRYVASDAHIPEHYEYLRKAMRKFTVHGSHARL